MSNIKLDITKAACFLEAGAVEAFEPKVKEAQKALEEGTCPGNDFLGWLHLPSLTNCRHVPTHFVPTARLWSWLVSEAPIWVPVLSSRL